MPQQNYLVLIKKVYNFYNLNIYTLPLPLPPFQCPPQLVSCIMYTQKSKFFVFLVTETNIYQVPREIRNKQLDITMFTIMSKQISLWTTLMRCIIIFYFSIYTFLPHPPQCQCHIDIQPHTPKLYIFIFSIFSFSLERSTPPTCII